MNWLAGGALVLALAMICGLLALVVSQGFPTFWPARVEEFVLDDGTVHQGEIAKVESVAPSAEVLAAASPESQARFAAAGGGASEQRLVRIGNYELTGEHFKWIDDWRVASSSKPEWAVVVEREAWGRFYGTPKAFLVDGKPTAETPTAAWAEFERRHEEVRDRVERRRSLERDEVGALNHAIEQGRRRVRTAELRYGRESAEALAAAAAAAASDRGGEAEAKALAERIAALDLENDRYEILMRVADGREQSLKLADVVRAYPANRAGLFERIGVFLSRWKEFLLEDPREANSEGGVWPAIFGTVVMTLLMSIVVVPFGVLAALYLREYAKQGAVVSAVRIAVNNLAGVPSIVFGVFGLGFFCYTVGGGIDALFFPERLPSPTFGTGGVLWSAATLALLTLPVVIVASEEALAAVPRSMREGSYACGASKWQTMRRIVLPRAAPGIMTGAILAMARGAGEVAPLMLVGAVKLAPELAIDGNAPFVHFERSFMHLGFHIYDLGFQSQNSEAAKPMVYTTTLLLISIIVVLNVAAIRIRSRLRRKFVGGAF